MAATLYSAPSRTFSYSSRCEKPTAFPPLPSLPSRSSVCSTPRSFTSATPRSSIHSSSPRVPLPPLTFVPIPTTSSSSVSDPTSPLALSLSSPISLPSSSETTESTIAPAHPVGTTFPSRVSTMGKGSFLSFLFGEQVPVSINLSVKLPSGTIHQCVVQPSYTVDQVKLLLFRSCQELIALKSSDFVLAAIDTETNSRTFLDVEFLKFRKLSKNILAKWKAGNEIHLSLLEKATLTELQRSSVFQPLKRSESNLPSLPSDSYTPRYFSSQNLKRHPSFQNPSPATSPVTPTPVPVPTPVPSTISPISSPTSCRISLQQSTTSYEAPESPEVVIKKKSKLTNIGSRILSSISGIAPSAQEPEAMVISSPFIPEERRQKEWQPVPVPHILITPLVPEEQKQLKVPISRPTYPCPSAPNTPRKLEIPASPRKNLEDEVSEVDWDELSCTLDSELFEDRLDHLEAEVEEQRRLRKQLEEQVLSLQLILNRTARPSPATEAAVAKRKIRNQTQNNESEDDLVFKKLQEGLNQMSEVLKETATKLSGSGSSTGIVGSGTGGSGGNGVPGIKKSLCKKQQRLSKLQRTSAIPPHSFKLEKIKDDFMKTEHNFINRVLKTIIDVYYDPLVRGNILSQKEIKSIFLDIQPFYTAQKEFYNQLTATRYTSNAELASTINQRMKELEGFDFFFIRYHTRALSNLKTLKHSNKKFRRFMRERENKPISIGLDLNSLLVKPVSHMASYKLLLERYLHTLPSDKENSEEKRFIVHMLENVHILLETLEIQRDQEENVRELLHLEEKIAGTGDSVGPIRRIGRTLLGGGGSRIEGSTGAVQGNFQFNKSGRKLLKQGKMLVYDSIGETKPRHFVLCNDILVILRENRLRKTFTILKVVPLLQIELGNITVAEHKHAFLLVTNHPYRDVWILATVTELDKNDWMRWINEAAQGIHDPKTLPTPCLVNPSSPSPSPSSSYPKVNSIN